MSPFASLALFLVAASPLAEAKPVLTYFSIAGRGELARLYAVVGNLDFIDSIFTSGYETKVWRSLLTVAGVPSACGFSVIFASLFADAHRVPPRAGRPRGWTLSQLHVCFWVLARIVGRGALHC